MQFYIFIEKNELGYVIRLLKNHEIGRHVIRFFLQIFDFFKKKKEKMEPFFTQFLNY